jgi:hypothetical protein
MSRAFGSALPRCAISCGTNASVVGDEVERLWLTASRRALGSDCSLTVRKIAIGAWPLLLLR